MIQTNLFVRNWLKNKTKMRNFRAGLRNCSFQSHLSVCLIKNSEIVKYFRGHKSNGYKKVFKLD